MNNNSLGKGLIIPYQELSSEALQGVIEEFVTRDGTDYGESEIALETKIQQGISVHIAEITIIHAVSGCRIKYPAHEKDCPGKMIVN